MLFSLVTPRRQVHERRGVRYFSFSIVAVPCLPGGSWGWPYKAQDKNPKIDADRPAYFSSRFVIFF